MRHAAVFTLGLSCGCLVFVRSGEVLGVALEAVEAGDELRLGRRCPLHGQAEVYAVAANAAGGKVFPEAMS